MPQGQWKVVGVDVHHFREALAAPNGQASPQQVVGSGVGNTAVRASGNIEACCGLMGGGPRSSGGNVSEDVAGGLVHAGEGELYEVTVDVNEASGMVTVTPCACSAVFVAPVGGYLAQVRPR